MLRLFLPPHKNSRNIESFSHIANSSSFVYKIEGLVAEHGDCFDAEFIKGIVYCSPKTIERLLKVDKEAAIDIRIGSHLSRTYPLIKFRDESGQKNCVEFKFSFKTSESWMIRWNDSKTPLFINIKLKGDKFISYKLSQRIAISVKPKIGRFYSGETLSEIMISLATEYEMNGLSELFYVHLKMLGVYESFKMIQIKENEFMEIYKCYRKLIEDECDGNDFEQVIKKVNFKHLGNNCVCMMCYYLSQLDDERLVKLCKQSIRNLVFILTHDERTADIIATHSQILIVHNSGTCNQIVWRKTQMFVNRHINTKISYKNLVLCKIL